ncbi:MAG: HAD-IB family hydrolase [Williamsia sp.]|nr:HAD-IB family hydrolase [Williamsia sp.]
MNKSIAFFDFDGTITTKDTLLEFIKFYRGEFNFYLGFLIYAPFLVAYKLGLIPNWVAKQKVLQFFFKGESIAQFQQRCEGFAAQKLPALLRPKALAEIKKLQAAGSTVVIVSASAENWIRPWAAQNNLGLMGTRLATKEGKITGKIDGQNCHGDEKVCRIKEKFDLAEYKEIYCYGDTSGDKPMLAIGTKSFYKPFR